MDFILINSSKEILVYVLQSIAILFVWLPVRVKVFSWLPTIKRSRISSVPLWVFVYILSLMTAVLFGLVNSLGLTYLGTLFIFCFFSREEFQNKIVRVGSLIIVVVLSFLLVAEQLGGFKDTLVIGELYLGTSEKAYSIDTRFDKGSVCLALIALAYSKEKSIGNTYKVILKTLPASISIVFAILFLGVLVGANLDIKVLPLVFLHMYINLIYTCILEEVYFRGILQHRLSAVFEDKKWWAWFSLFVISILFGVAHIGGGFELVVLATLAGVGYGYLYNKYRKLEVSIFCHFLMNLFIFIILEYPVVFR